MTIVHLFEDLISLQDYMNGLHPDHDVDLDMNQLCAAHPGGIRITLKMEGV